MNFHHDSGPFLLRRRKCNYYVQENRIIQIFQSENSKTAKINILLLPGISFMIHGRINAYMY